MRFWLGDTRWRLAHPICGTYGKHFSLGDHQDRLASSFLCSQAESMVRYGGGQRKPLGRTLSQIAKQDIPPRVKSIDLQSNEEVGMGKIESRLVFPTLLHQAVGDRILEYFSKIRTVDTVLAVNSCARGQGVPESDLDFAILVQPAITVEAIAAIERDWTIFSEADSKIKEYKAFSKFSHLHLDIISGNYIPTPVELGAPVDSFELEIGNQIRYSAPMRVAGRYFEELQSRWLPYYGRELRLNRFEMMRTGCRYEIDHIPLYVNRGLFFQAFDLLYRAFQKFLQVLFIGSAIYPIAYNKWIKYQIEEILAKPELYNKLPPIISLSNIESNEIIKKAEMLQYLLNQVEYV